MSEELQAMRYTPLLTGMPGSLVRTIKTGRVGGPCKGKRLKSSILLSVPDRRIFSASIQADGSGKASGQRSL